MGAGGGVGNQPIDSSLPPKRVVQAWPGLSFLSLLYSLMLQRYLHFFFQLGFQSLLLLPDFILLSHF